MPHIHSGNNGRASPCRFCNLEFVGLELHVRIPSSLSQDYSISLFSPFRAGNNVSRETFSPFLENK